MREQQGHEEKEKGESPVVAHRPHWDIRRSVFVSRLMAVVAL